MSIIKVRTLGTELEILELKELVRKGQDVKEDLELLTQPRYLTPNGEWLPEHMVPPSMREGI